MADKENLTPQQIQAIALLIEGKNDRETAEAVGVSRVTINTWKNKDFNFMAEYNSRVNHIQEVIEASQQEAILKAYKVVHKALDSELKKDDPDARVALGIIKNYKPKAKLNTSPKILENRQKTKEQDEEYLSTLFFT